MRPSFRSGRLPQRHDTLENKHDGAAYSQARRQPRRGRGRHPASRTLDLGKLGRDEELGISDGAPAQLRSGGLKDFFRNLFSRGEDTRTRPRHRGFHAADSGRFTNGSRGPGASGGFNIPSSGRLGRHAAASSLGSLQSYATSTIRASSSPMPSCLSQGSTSEVGMKKRVQVNKDLDNQLVFSQQARDNSLLQNRPQKFEFPKFALAEFGAPETWHSDIFVLPHNAIRWEIMDLYNILSSLHARWNSLTMVDIWQISEYWEVFEVFVGQYFEIEDQIVFPFMLNIASESTDLKRYHKVVKYNRDRLEAMLLEVGTTLELFNSWAASEVLPKLYTQLSQYLPKLLDYMEQQENVLPGVFQQYCEPDDRALLNRASANFIIRAANGRDGIAILTRWIEDSMILQVWKNENLSSRAQSSHKRWIANLENAHVEIANNFKRRMRTMPRADTGGKSRSGLEDRYEPSKRSANKNSFKGSSRRGLQ